MKTEHWAQLQKEAEQRGLILSNAQLEKFATYQDLLLARNEQVNLTAITDPEEVVTKHFLDSLAPLFVPALARRLRTDGASFLDVGTGAGFPGVPLAIAAPNLHVTLLDAQKKRVKFLRELIKELDLSNITVLEGRAEEAARDAAHREAYAAVASRAVAELRVLCEYCLPFLAIGGIFVSYKGGQADVEYDAAQGAIALLGGEQGEIYPYSLPVNDAARSLIVIEKVDATPDKYPRRAGIPTKRPL